MLSPGWRWTLGLTYIILVAIIWIAASYIVQSVVDAGVSPFLITYICNSLFVIYIPLFEISHYLEGMVKRVKNFSDGNDDSKNSVANSLEEVNLLAENTMKNGKSDSPDTILDVAVETGAVVDREEAPLDQIHGRVAPEFAEKQHWSRLRVAKVSLLICPFWFIAQLTFNCSLKYTTVTSNTILSSSSSLFTFLVALAFLGERFIWVKFFSVLLCMAGTVIVSLGDAESIRSYSASNPLLGDILALVSAGVYSVYITLIRKKLPDESKGEGEFSMALFLGYLGLFNLIIFLPVAIFLNFTGLEPFHALSWQQVGLIVGKGLLDNVLSDYLWAKAVLLTTTTVATAGLTIQVPLAAAVDAITGSAPHLLDYLGGAAVLVGFVGINFPNSSGSSKESIEEIHVDSHNSQIDAREIPQT